MVLPQVRIRGRLKAGVECGSGMGMIRFGVAAMGMIAVIAANGCRWQGPDYQHMVPFVTGVYGLLVEDIDLDGRQDLLMTTHGGNTAQAWFQKTPRRFVAGPLIGDVGFHPGQFMRWVKSDKPLYLLNAEGSNQLINFSPTTEGGLKKLGSVGEHAPVQSVEFRWPGWGTSLAITPYRSDGLILLRDIDRETLEYKERIVVPMSQEKPTIREAGLVDAADLDGDGIEELIFTVGINQEVMKIAYPEDRPLQVERLAKLPRKGVPNEVLISDLNGDKAPDLVVPDKVPGGWLHILLNDGAGHLTEYPLKNPFPGQELQKFSVGMGPDGKNLLLIAGTEAIHLVTLPTQWKDSSIKLDSQTVKREQREACQALSLKDLDGDGNLDAVVGLSRNGEGAWVVYGPLWEHFEDMAKREFKVQKPVDDNLFGEWHEKISDWLDSRMDNRTGANDGHKQRKDPRSAYSSEAIGGKRQ